MSIFGRWNKKKYVIESSELAQKLITELYENDPENETFDQVGFLNGHEIVMDYINYNELGCALSHLLYMIHESDIRYPRERVLCLHDLAEKIGERNYYSKENQKNLTEE